MNDSTKAGLGIAAAIFIVVVMGISGWKLERNINYSWSYKDQVQKTVREEVQPLQERIAILEAEISILKTNR